MPITLLFHHYAIIIFAIVMRKKINNYPGSYWDKVKFASKRCTLFLIIPMLFDIYHGYLLLNPKKLGDFYKEYQTLDREGRSDFGDCLLGSGPFGSVLCPKLFADRESLLRPTEKNLPGRLAECDFGHKPYDPLFFEAREICDSAFEDLSNSNNKTMQKRVFDTMVSIGNDLGCDKKGLILFYMKYLTFLKQEVKLWRHKNLIKNKCYNLFDWFDDRKDPEFLSNFDSTFSKLDFSSFNEDESFIIKGHLVSIIPLYYRNKHQKYKISPIYVHIFRESLIEAHKRDQIDVFVSNVRKFLEIENPELAKVYPYYFLEDGSWLKNY